jgi:pyruvate kinase
MDAGVDLFRLNFSHGSNDVKREAIGTVRQLSRSHGRQIGILADLQGPKIRTGRMRDGALPLAKGDLLDITTDDVLGRRGLISTIYRALLETSSPARESSWMTA